MCHLLTEGLMAEEPTAATEPTDEPTPPTGRPTSADEDTTVAELQALIQIPGALRVITNEVQPELRVDKDDPRSPANEGVDLRDPAVFVQHHVTNVEGPDARGRYIATSDEGSYVTGYPNALLSRLRQWRGN
jgi:hypothetical protein